MKTKVQTKRRNDIILMAGLLIVGIILFVVVSMSAQGGGSVDVQVDGKSVASYSLSENREIALNYNGYNLLVIKDGEAQITKADCPDKLCTQQRKISKSGETIVCLPHKTVIKVNDGSGNEESEFDGVVQ